MNVIWDLKVKGILEDEQEKSHRYDNMQFFSGNYYFVLYIYGTGQRTGCNDSCLRDSVYTIFVAGSLGFTADWIFQKEQRENDTGITVTG